jgi:glycosyltransferase involved in cell wall biosynthesis
LKILVISPVYALSGVPLGQLRLANSLCKIGHDVDLIYGSRQYSKIEKSKNIKIIFFNKLRVLGMFFPLLKYLLFKKPDIIFSAEDHLNALVVIACIITFSNAKISVSSRVTPYDTYRNLNIIFSKAWFLKKIFPIVNWKANVLTCVSKDMVKQYKTIFPYTRQVYAYNVVLTEEAILKMKDDIDHKWFKSKKNQLIVATGTLAYWKGFDDLINAINILVKKKINLKLIIIGDGPDKNLLKKLIKSNKLTQKIQILKPVLNTLKYFYNSDIFVLSSRVEGMPNVMIEAMMCGCTVVATNCYTGPKEIIGKNKYGYLAKVNNPLDLSKNIFKAMNKKISPNKTKKILNEFTVEEVIKKHFLLLKIKRKNWLI